MTKKKQTIYRVAAIGVFAALVFVGSSIYVPIPVAVGDMTRFHLGNIFCLLSGFVLGPIGGGLAAGIGSALFDLMTPAYIASAPFTFAFKFLMAAVCGWVAYARGSRAGSHIQNIFAAIAGNGTYVVLYLGKSLVQGMLLGNSWGAMMTSLAAKLVTSSVNMAIAVVAAVPLCAVVRLALKKSRLLEKMV